jgi:hypothetical protein
MVTDENQLVSKTNSKRIAIIATSVVLGVLSLFVCYWLSTIDLDLELNYSHRVPMLPTAEAQYQEMLAKVASATTDELLADRVDEKPVLWRNAMGCIVAGGERLYGTNRSHEDVLADFDKTFAAIGWQHQETSFFTNTESVIIVFINPLSPDYTVLGKGKYETIYRVGVLYSDPQRFGCFG